MCSRLLQNSARAVRLEQTRVESTLHERGCQPRMTNSTNKGQLISAMLADTRPDEAAVVVEARSASAS
jgi:hypothetical protein